MIEKKYSDTIEMYVIRQERPTLCAGHLYPTAVRIFYRDLRTVFWSAIEQLELRILNRNC